VGAVSNKDRKLGRSWGRRYENAIRAVDNLEEICPGGTASWVNGKV